MTPGLWRCRVLLCIATLLTGCGTVAGDAARTADHVRTADQVGTADHAGPASVPPTPSSTAAPTTAPVVSTDGLGLAKQFRSVRGHAEPPPPSSVRIPAIGVDSPLVTLGKEPDGTVEVPADFQRAGWYGGGAVPGQPGPAVILGHVDSRAGPAVFYRLHELEPGEEIVVDRVDGSSARFTVDHIKRFSKDAFPTRAVYYPTLKSTLRLVTCGGVFDADARSYRDNIVVFASRAP